MSEIWREIEDSNGWMVSSEGNIKNSSGELVKPKSSMGYLRVSYNGHREWVHILVAKAFIANPFNKPQVDHKNDVRNDNRVSNLQWCTSRENTMFAAKAGKFKNCGRRRAIVAVNIITKEEKYFDTQAEAEKKLGIHNSEINKALRGERKTTHGFQFFYLDEYTNKLSKSNYEEWVYATEGRQISLFDVGVLNANRTN